MMRDNWKDLAQLHFVVLIFGFTGILGKFLSLDAFIVVWYRLLLALPFLIAYHFWKKRNQKQSPLRLKQILKLVGAGAIISAHWISFFHAINVSNVSVTLATLSCTALFVSIVEPLIIKEKRWIRHELLLGLVVIGGLVAIFSFETKYALGITYALISAFLAGLFGILNGQFIKSIPAHTISTYEIGGGFLILTLFMLFTGVNPVNVMSALGFNDWVWLLLLGIVATAYAFVAIVKVMRSVSPFTVALSINMEPIYTIVLALFLFKTDEHMSSGFYFGAAIIILTLFVNSFVKARLKKQK